MEIVDDKSFLFSVASSQAQLSQYFNTYIERLKSLHKHETVGNHKKSNTFLISISPCHPALNEKSLESLLEKAFELDQFGHPPSWWAVKELTPSLINGTELVQHLHILILEHNNSKSLHDGKRYRSNLSLMDLCHPLTNGEKKNVKVSAHDSFHKGLQYLCKTTPPELITNDGNWRNEFIPFLKDNHDREKLQALELKNKKIKLNKGGGAARPPEDMSINKIVTLISENSTICDYLNFFRFVNKNHPALTHAVYVYRPPIIMLLEENRKL